MNRKGEESMKKAILAVPPDESEKAALYAGIGTNYITKETLLERYVDLFIARNHLKHCSNRSIFLKRLIFSLVLFVVLALEVVWMFFYHTRGVIVLMIIELLVYLVLFRKQKLKDYLLREVKLRPDDNIDNILVSQVSGAKKGWVGVILGVAPIIIVMALTVAVFWKPHMIFEKQQKFPYNDFCSLRYYTWSFSPEKHVFIPDEHDGLPVKEIRGDVFKNVSSLKYIRLPSAITEIRGSTFENCKNLWEVDIPEGVTRIGGHAFYGCRRLRKVTVPSTVQSIGSSAFRQCDSLYTIDIPKSADVNSKAFKESPTKVNYY